MARHGLTAFGLLIAAGVLATAIVRPWPSSEASLPAWPTPAPVTPVGPPTPTPAAHPAYPTDPATGALLVVEITRTPVPRPPTATPRPYVPPTETPDPSLHGGTRVGR